MATRKARSLANKAVDLPGAVRAPMPSTPLKPQIPTLRDEPPTGDEWMHELKWDGYRQTVVILDGRAQIWSRNSLPWTDKLPGIAAALENLPVRDAILDGELVAGQGRRDDFGLLQQILASKAKKGPLTFILFDLVYVDGVSLMSTPLLARKELLEELAGVLPPGLAYSSHVVGDATAAFAMAEEQGFEGIVSKRVDRPYVPGRGTDWLKCKVEAVEQFAVVGYTPTEGLRTGFASLLLARATGNDWEYVGRVGTGFSAQDVRSIWPLLANASDTPTVAGPIDRSSLRDAKWFSPRFVVEVFVRGVGFSGVLRQASFKGVRTDKLPTDLRLR
jgi:bifunctional non-homologous end joining protein LigD